MVRRRGHSPMCLNPYPVVRFLESIPDGQSAFLDGFEHATNVAEPCVRFAIGAHGPADDPPLVLASAARWAFLRLRYPSGVWTCARRDGMNLFSVWGGDLSAPLAVLATVG